MSCWLRCGALQSLSRLISNVAVIDIDRLNDRSGTGKTQLTVLAAVESDTVRTWHGLRNGRLRNELNLTSGAKSFVRARPGRRPELNERRG